MTFFRSQEVQRLCVLLGLTTAVAAAAGFCRDVWTGLAALGGSLAVAAVALLFTAWRYREMEKLAANLRRIAGGDYSLDVRDNEEGELSILKSELYKVTAMLSEYNERLRQEKVSLSDSMADISHQLRTPLTAMRLTLSLLEQEELTPQRRLALMRELKKLTGRMEWLVEALLKMAQLDAGTVVFHPQDTTAAELVRRAAEPLEVPMEVRSIRFTAQAGEERLTCDVPWSTEALGNILKNCMEHAASWVQVTARETAIFTEITVQDDGPGFDPEELPGKPGLYGYGDPIELPCPIELISMGGIICTEQDGKISLHVHAAFADESGAAFGGHFKEGNRVLTTVEMVIGELDHINMSRAIDPERGVPVFTPLQL